MPVAQISDDRFPISESRELPMTDTATTMSVRDAARRLGVHENTIRNWMNAGNLAFEPMPGPSGFRRPLTASVERVAAQRANPGANLGVHASHCCVRHGCKYGDLDCPIVGGAVSQEYPCEYCTMDEEEHEDHLLQVTVMKDGTVEIWLKQGLDASELAALLRQVADGTEAGEAS